MAIYRGAGGAGDATGDSASEALLVRELAAEVAIDAAAAEAAKQAALAAQTAAELAETNAETAETNAETAETNAETAQAAAASSASAAATSATNAANSATAAQTAETNAETAETNAETAQAAAASSASAASTSASNAASSASAASTSATNASNSATSAASSASTATTQATNASNSATAAATSATNASNSATSASTSATTATTQAGIATTQATNAASSASAASTSATNASNSASAAATSATNASNSASAASTSASNASTSATNAANSATAASGFADDASDSADAAAASAASINLSSIAITGGSINGTTIGASSASTGAFTTATASTSFGSPVFKATSSAGGALQNSGGTNCLQWGGGGGSNLTLDVNTNVTGAIALNGGTTIGDASGDSFTINSSAVSIPNGLNFDSNTLVIDATNNRVGVGTASPSQALDVTGNINSTGNILTGDNKAIGFGSNAYFLGNSTSSFLTAYTAGSERMRIDSSGNVGIGTSSPASRLTVNGVTTFVDGGDARVGTIRFASGAFQIISAATELNIDTPSSYIALRTGAAGTATERMRIDSSGNLLVGTTTSPSGSGNMFVNGVVYIGTTNTDPTFNRVNGFNLLTQGRLYTRSNGSWDMGRDATSGTHITFYTDNGSARVSAGNIASNGSTTSYNTASDYRMKENIAPMTGALATIQALKPITYDWKDEFVGTKKSTQGFIAHELAEVVPDCVTGEKDAVDAEGNPQYQGIDTSFLVATLTAAIQELKAEVDALKAQINQ